MLSVLADIAVLSGFVFKKIRFAGVYLTLNLKAHDISKSVAEVPYNAKKSYSIIRIKDLTSSAEVTLDLSASDIELHSKSQNMERMTLRYGSVRNPVCMGFGKD